jgi:hypothetical protein
VLPLVRGLAVRRPGGPATVGYVSQLPSILVPLETLATLPLALADTPLNVLLLLFGFPLLAIIIVSILVTKTAVTKAARDPGGRYSDPTWVGANGEEQRVGDNTGTGALPGRSAPEGTAGEQGADKGGASARW